MADAVEVELEEVTPDKAALPTAARSPSSSSGKRERTDFEDINEVFEPASVKEVFSKRLRYHDALAGRRSRLSSSYVEGWQFEYEQWASTQEDVNAVINAFSESGFVNIGSKGYAAPGTVITGTWP